MTLEFVELPAPPYGHGQGRPYPRRKDSADLWAISDELRQHPLRWVRYPRKLSTMGLKSTYNMIMAGSLAAFDATKGFEAAVRGDTLYVRFNPDRASTERANYNAGFEDGVKRGRELATAELRSALAEWRHRLVEIAGGQE
jgi:hypothetical protein